MPILKFPLQINSPIEKVWDTLWNDATYRQWTAAFCEGSYAKGDWSEGSKMLFLDSKGDGMFGIIEESIPNKTMIIRHLGEIKNHVEEPKDWGDSLECYYLESSDGVTNLNAELHTKAEFGDYLNNTFPKALENLEKYL